MRLAKGQKDSHRFRATSMHFWSKCRRIARHVSRGDEPARSNRESLLVQVLKSTHGLVPEFVNPKYKEGKTKRKSAFRKATRLECMMQVCEPASSLFTLNVLTTVHIFCSLPHFFFLFYYFFSFLLPPFGSLQICLLLSMFGPSSFSFSSVSHSFDFTPKKEILKLAFFAWLRISHDSSPARPRTESDSRCSRGSRFSWKKCPEDRSLFHGDFVQVARMLFGKE